MDGTFGAQSTLLSNASLSEFVDLTRRSWVTNQEHIARNARQLFIEDTVEGSLKRYNEVDTSTYADTKVEGADSLKARVGTGYFMDLNLKTVSKEIDITLEMRQDNRYPEVKGLVTGLNEFCDNRMDLDLTHRLTFAGDTSYTDMNGNTITTEVGDGLALGSASHTLAFSATTFNNLVTGGPAFSESSLESAMLIAATQIFSNFGEKRNMNFNTIVTGNDPGTVRTVRQILESTADVDAAQAGVKNVYSGEFNHVILPNLATTAVGAYNSAKRRYWALVAANQGINGWQAYLGVKQAPTLVTPSSGSNGEDIHNFNWTFSAYSRYGIVTVSPKGVVVSLVVS